MFKRKFGIKTNSDMLNLVLRFTFHMLDQKYCKFGPKIQNCLVKANLNMKNSTMIFFFYFALKISFLEKWFKIS